MVIGKRTTRRRTYRRSRKSIRRRRYNKRFRRGAKSGIMMKMPSTIVTPRMLTKVKYTDSVTLTGFTTPTTDNDLNAFSYKDIVINASYPYGPYGINPSDLPAGLTLWSQFYNEVAVTKCKVKIIPVSFIGSPTDPYVLPYVVSLTPIVSFTTAIPYNSGNTDFIEQPLTRKKYFSVGGNQGQISLAGLVYVNAQGTYQVAQSLSHSMTSKKMLGYKSLFDCDINNVWIPTQTTASPGQSATAWVYNLSVKSNIPWDGTSATGPFIMDNLVCKIEIEYSLAFRNRKPQIEETPPTP